MMEAALIVSLIFGGWNWWAKEQAHDDVARLEKSITIYEQNLDTLLEANESNASTIDSLEAANGDCAARYSALLEDVNNFRSTTVAQDVAIKRLQDRLRGSAFAQCRVPDGVSLEGIETP